MAEWWVSASGRSDFGTIQEALDAVPRTGDGVTTIHLGAGVYREKLALAPGAHVHLIGEGADCTRIEWDDFAKKPHPDGTAYGTFRTPSVTVAGDGVVLQDLTIANTAVPRSDVGQAVALAVTGDKFWGRRLRLQGHQDTLFTGGHGRQVFTDCFIAGDVDYIFGPAAVFFDRCQVHSVGRGYLTAASTPEDSGFGYVFWKCRLTGETGATSYLGRPWRPYASVVFVATEMGAHVLPLGWDDWRNPENQKTARYYEFGSFGPGADDRQRAAWATARAVDQVPAAWERTRILARWEWSEDEGRDGWC